ncbi:hypothetical protein LX32DRAFT_218750 [Colletotrichum zoysiae]|uniref:Uncharacterized protein n=1 Tax=Colletotrichum zoysiae TaxID=1216348 RepID=A0AAD9HNK3_9PEZI|nr:hypothetical protein LX32DRAFT_218750 [Colletotrichum zoysiae]
MLAGRERERERERERCSGARTPLQASYHCHPTPGCGQRARVQTCGRFSSAARKRSSVDGGTPRKLQLCSVFAVSLARRATGQPFVHGPPPPAFCSVPKGEGRISDCMHECADSRPPPPTPPSFHFARVGTASLCRHPHAGWPVRWLRPHPFDCAAIVGQSLDANPLSLPFQTGQFHPRHPVCGNWAPSQEPPPFLVRLSTHPSLPKSGGREGVFWTTQPSTAIPLMRHNRSLTCLRNSLHGVSHPALARRAVIPGQWANGRWSPRSG